MLTTFAIPADLRARLITLTPRQREVLALWARGHDFDTIGAALGITYKTVDSHLQQGRQRLGAPPGVAGGRWLSYALGALDAAHQEAP